MRNNGNCARCGVHIISLKPHPEHCTRFTTQVTVDYQPDLGHGTFFLVDGMLAELEGEDLQNVRIAGLPTYSLHECIT